MEKTREQPCRPEVIGSFIGMGMVGFCFGIGLILAVKTVGNLEYCIDEIIRKSENQVQQEPQQVMKEPQRVTTKDPKKVEAGKRLAASIVRREK